MNKHAFLKTAEVMFAVVIAIVFIAYVFPSPISKSDQGQDYILRSLESNNEFRQLVMLNTTRCIDADIEIQNYLPAKFKYSYQLDIVSSSELNMTPEDLPKDKQVYVDSLFIAGNNSQYNPKVLKLYYWSR
jgi:hypothetical protein